MRRTLSALVLLAACSTPDEVRPDALPLGLAEVAGGDEIGAGASVLSDEVLSPLFARQFVLHVDGDVSPAALDALDALGATDLRATSARGSYRFDADADVEDVSAALTGAVAWVEPVVRYAPQSVDPDLAWAWHHAELAVPEAWAHTRGAGAVVAVLDTGVLRTGELGITGADDIEHLEAQVDYVPVSPVQLTSTLAVNVPHDDVSHGTHVANTIAARADNGLQSAGIAPEATVLPVRVGGQDGISSEHLADALRLAADRGADVINLSLGSPIYSQLVADAVVYAQDRGALVVAASGNEYQLHRVMYPAALDGVLAVGASTSDHRVADYSNRGPELDLVAPGGDDYDGDRNGMIDGILATTWLPIVGVPGLDDGVYVTDAFFNGTSMATATVSGAAALLVSLGADSEEVVAYLEASAVDLGEPGWDETSGHGVVDVGAAVAAWVADHQPAPPATLGELVPGDLAVTEVMADPSVCASDTCEWFELQNLTGRDVDLAGLTVRDESGNSGVLGSVVVAAGGRIVVGRGAVETFVHPDLVPGAFYGAAVTLNNSGDLVSLSAGTTVLATSPRWGTAPSGVSLTAQGAAWVSTATLGATALPVSGEVATPGR